LVKSKINVFLGIIFTNDEENTAKDLFFKSLAKDSGKCEQPEKYFSTDDCQI
jgi:hypothetical protein